MKVQKVLSINMFASVTVAVVLFSFPASSSGKGESTEAKKRLEGAVKSITSKELKDSVNFLAGDALEGRGAGTAGEKKAAGYIVKEFERLKLKPSKKNEYRQGIDVLKGKTHNIIGLLEGSDEELKKEYVILAAHHDHLAKASRGRDKIFNGADDNASGVAAVLEVAEAFAENQLQPKRTIIFITFTAEEKGLLGSKQYVRRPPFPINQHIAMINLDMIGRNPKKPLRVSGIGTCAEWEKIVKRAAGKTKLKCTLAPGFTGRMDGSSDHEPFGRKKIPVLSFFTGYHRDYHRASDHADKLDYNRLEKIARMVLITTLETANLPEKPKFTAPVKAKRKK